jgi:hypothetical protein
VKESMEIKGGVEVSQAVGYVRRKRKNLLAQCFSCHSGFHLDKSLRNQLDKEKKKLKFLEGKRKEDIPRSVARENLKALSILKRLS